MCRTMIDGFYVQAVLLSVLGLLWIFWARRTINYLESIDVNAFRVKPSVTVNELSLHGEHQPLPLLTNNADSKATATERSESASTAR